MPPFLGLDTNGNIIYYGTDSNEIVARAERRHVIASGDTTGATDRAAIQAILSSNQNVYLSSDDIYYIDQVLTIPSGCFIVGNDTLPAKIWAGSAFSDTAADSRTGSMIRIAGSDSGSVSTTLSATAQMGSSSVVVTLETNITSDSWYKLEGSNAADLFYGQSDTEIVIELIKVSSSYVSGTTIPLTRRLSMHHALNKSFVSYSPVIGAAIYNVELYANNKTIAVGIEITNSVDIIIENVFFRKFSRSCIDISGSKGVRVYKAINKGDSNALIHASSAQNVNGDYLHCTGEYDRVHASGNPRPQITLDDHCVECVFKNLNFRKVAGCIRFWGGICCGVDGLVAHDVDCAEIVSRDAYMLLSNVNANFGSVFDGGPAHIPFATFGFGCFVKNVVATAVTQPHIENQCALYYHDHWNMILDNILIQNKGDSPFDSGSYLNGIRHSDADGILTNHTLIGVYTAYRTKNAINNMLVDNLHIDTRAGAGSASGIGIYYDHAGAANTSPTFQTVRVANAGNYVYFGVEWTSSPDRTARIINAYFDGFIASNVYAHSVTGSPAGGQVVRITGGATDCVLETTGPSYNNGVNMTTPSNSWTMVALGDAVIKHTGTAAVRGDLLVADNAGNVVVNNTPTYPNTTWRAVVASASGYVNAQKVG